MQWEHPQTAFLTGVVRRLTSAAPEAEAARERKEMEAKLRGSPGVQSPEDKKKSAVADARNLAGNAGGARLSGRAAPGGASASVPAGDAALWVAGSDQSV